MSKRKRKHKPKPTEYEQEYIDYFGTAAYEEELKNLTSPSEASKHFETIHKFIEQIKFELPLTDKLRWAFERCFGEDKGRDDNGKAA